MHFKSIRIFALSLLFSGCANCSTLDYLLNQVPGQIDILTDKVPVEDVIKDPKTGPHLKRTLELSQMAKKYAHDEIGLKKNRNYTEFKDLKRDFVILSLVAAPKTKLEPYTWTYPFFGKFPYIGYFDPKEAEKEEKKFQEKGYDTRIRKVQAYSTLGWFRDAILNTMTDSPPSLAETIIHEQVHATVYHKDAGKFNENIALFIGIQGTIEFLRTLDEKEWPEKNEWIKQIGGRTKKQEAVNHWVETATKRLNELYQNPNLTEEQKLKQREKTFEDLQTLWKKTVNPSPIPNLNNAFIVSLGTYTDNYAEMEAKYKELGSLKAMVEWAKQNPPKKD